MSEQERDYFLPGEYIGDAHYGDARIRDRIEERHGVYPTGYKRVNVEIHSEEQRKAMEQFLDATRRLFSPGDFYLNKMVVALDENTAAYMYDNKTLGIVTF